MKSSPPTSVPEKLTNKCGVFVTLNKVKNGFCELRGCIGYPQPMLPLVLATMDSAINSATADPRFPSVSYEEMKNIIMEISVLTPPHLIKINDARLYPQKIEISKDGLIIERGWFKGLLLPQVPVEHNWDEEEFLANCCMKAGLQPDSWLIEGTKIYKFSCIIARELTPDGEIELVDMRNGGSKSKN